MIIRHPDHPAFLHVVTHRDFFAQADLCQHVLDALSAAHLPDGGLCWLVGDGPVPRLQLVPNSAESTTIGVSVAGLNLLGVETRMTHVLTQTRTRQLHWKRASGPHCCRDSSYAQSLEPDNKSSRGEVSARSLA